MRYHASVTRLIAGALRCFLHILKSRVVEKRVRRNRRQPRLYHRPVGDRGAESHTAVHVARQQRKNHAGYSQVPEVDVVPQTVVVDFKQSVLIGYVSARTNNNNGDDNSQNRSENEVAGKHRSEAVKIEVTRYVPPTTARSDQLG